MQKLSSLLIASILFIAYSCSKYLPIDPTPNPDGQTDSSYFYIESFEAGEKKAYAIGDIELKTGAWSFDDALIGNLDADAKDSSWSVRLRTGSITTNFKISGLQKVYVSSALYGNDKPSSWTLQVSEDGHTFTNIGDPINVDTKTFRLDSFTITDSGPVQLRIIKTGKDRINIDNVIFAGAAKESGIHYTNNPGADNNDDDDDDPDTDEGRSVIAGNDAPPLTGDNSNLLFGNPSNADSTLLLADNYLINQHYYISSYSSSRGTPNWTAWHIDKTNITSVADRQDDFGAWAGLPTGWYKIQSGSYRGSGYDRGHNCPSADRTSSVAANSSTFLMTNMIPQSPQNNQQTWNNLEQYIRDQVKTGKEAYVIMGSYGNAGTIDNGHITIPTNVWKIVVLLDEGDQDISRVTANTRIITVNTPNDATADPDWKKYRTSVKAIEEATGYKLLSVLPDHIKKAILEKVDTN